MPSAQPRPSRSELDALRRVVAVLARDQPLAAADSIPERLVRYHQLGPLAYKAGAAAFRTESLASGLAAELRFAVLREVLDALAVAAVPAAPIKGMAYVGTLYPDPGDRPMSDIDLLVPAELHGAAAAILIRLGYTDRSKPVARSPVHHASTFVRRGAAIDLHRTIVQPHRSRIDLPAVWRRARPAPELGPTAHRLDSVDLTLFHLIHIARHELLVPAISYVDAARLLAAADRAALASRARDWRLRRAVRAALAMTDALAAGCPRADLPGPAPLAWLLPTVAAVLGHRRPARPLQLARKAALLEGPAELAGLARVCWQERAAGRFAANASSGD